MTQMSMFGPTGEEHGPKPSTDAVERLKVLVTVKAAPNPSDKYGDTVCVAGVSADLAKPRWIRLYPINFRELSTDASFRKYDIISIDAKPARSDPRGESWKPFIETLTVESHLPRWAARKVWVEPYIEQSMCRLNRDAQASAAAQSLALIRPREVSALKIEAHPGWTREEQLKIDAWVHQLDAFDERHRIPLRAPRFKARYKYRCGDASCKGHVQGLLDWEFVALQRTLATYSDHELQEALESKFLHMMCRPDHDFAFYVGNQAKRAHVFSVLGVYYPPK